LLGELAEAGVKLDAVTDGLERSGVESFRDSYQRLLDCIETRLADLRAGDRAAALIPEAGR
jgi:hypothetical protein